MVERGAESKEIGEALLKQTEQLFNLWHQARNARLGWRGFQRLIAAWVRGVEPTNNQAERALWRAVLWRRKSFGTQSAAGSQFVERILTVVTTLRQQGRDVLQYLTTACTSALGESRSVCLLPDSS